MGSITFLHAQFDYIKSFGIKLVNNKDKKVKFLLESMIVCLERIFKNRIYHFRRMIRLTLFV